MHAIVRISALAACGVMLAGFAYAQGADASGQGKAQSDAQAATPASTAVQSETDASAQTHVDATAMREAMVEKASKVSAEAKAKAESHLDAAAQKVDAQAQKSGDAVVASRLSMEFGSSAAAMTAEKTELNASWGELMIAHSLAANLKTQLTTAQLVQWHQDHMGWGQMAAGLGLELRSVTTSVDAETRVAQGMARGDGKVAVMHGEGARSVGAGLDLGAGAAAGKGSLGTSATAGLGVKIGH